MNIEKLAKTARSLVANHRGILASDESTGTIKNRFDGIGVVSTADSRRDYRELLFRTKGVVKFVSGAILYDETIRQKAANGMSLVRVMKAKNIQPGIKVDAGAKPLAGAPGETVTEGLDGLNERVAEYAKLGATFAKWRAVIDIGRNIPSPYAIHTNAHALARYARICQEGGLVPIVEPEVLMDGGHDIVRCQEVTEQVLAAVFNELNLQGVPLEGILLKPNMVISGKKCAKQASAKEIAERTLECFRRTVPAAVPGIVFLSGGQSMQDATANLNAMNAMGPSPWKLSFSYGRALQEGPLKAWKGITKNVPAAQSSLLKRARLNSAACKGSYRPAMEKAAAKK
ncbi:MAG: fructose-bisphosphate aldolase class I [Proteobacteria bacterium]|nr:fructose-bisphosphate aldolase class I [Pseudomonadota bacterium]